MPRDHLVVAGDILDKGPKVTRTLWLVKKLEREAEEAGGRLHFLLGNHEYLALTGQSRIICQRLAEFDHVDERARAELLLIEDGRLTGVAATGARRPL